MTAQALCQALQIEKLPSFWLPFFEEVRLTWKARSAELLNPEILPTLLDSVSGLEAYKQEILRSAEALVTNTPLCQFMCLLERSIREIGHKYTEEILFPQGDGPEYRFYCLIPMLTSFEASRKALEERHLPETVIRETLLEYANCIYLYSLHNGYPGFGALYYNWCQLLADHRLLHIGRFQYELVPHFTGKIAVLENSSGELAVLAQNVWVHRSGQLLGSCFCKDRDGAFFAELTETEDAWRGFPILEAGLVEKEAVCLSKEDWRLCLREGMPVISVHIPRMGSLAPEECERSYTEAKKLFARHYPDFPYRAFVCHSWMMDRQLTGLLKPEANILAFQRKYHPFPLVSNGQAVFTFVFLRPQDRPLPPVDYTKLPETTSLERCLKEHYLQGRCIYEAGGFFL